MRAVPSDTHPKAAEYQLELLRKATPAERLAVVRSLSRTVIELSRRALRRRNPDATQRELDRAFVALHYGEETARRLLDGS